MKLCHAILEPCHVMPAKAGTQRLRKAWVPAFAGMTQFHKHSLFLRQISIKSRHYLFLRVLLVR